MSKVIDFQAQAGAGKAHEIEYGDLLVHYLEKQGVEYAFGIPGGALEPLYNAMARSKARGGLVPILTKHEGGAAFMADGYARVSGKLGVCCATTGPGGTNMLTGIASAFADSVPVLALTGQIPIGSFGKGAVQDSTQEGVDMVEVYRRTTLYSAMVFSPQLADTMFRKAFSAALSGRRGPVHLSLPSDVVAAPVDVENIDIGFGASHAPARYWDRDGVKEAARLLASARKPAMLLGAGALWSDAADEIAELANLLTMPCATSPKAKGMYPENGDLALGCFGFGGSPRAEAYLLDEDIDVLLSVGHSFNEMGTQAWNQRLGQGRTIIQVDIDPRQFGKNYSQVLPLQGDAKVVLRELLYELQRVHRISETERALRAKAFAGFCRDRPLVEEPEKMESCALPLKPQRLMADLRRALPEDTIFFVDIGSNLAWTLHYLRITRPGTFYAAIGYSSMGFGVAASIGGKLAAPNRPVVAIVGDGGFLMHGMEVATAVNHHVPVIWVVLNDAGLGMVRHGQRMSPRALEVCHSFERVDFKALATVLGARGVRVTRPGEINTEMMAEIIAGGQPTVIDVVIDAEEAPPIGSRVKAIGSVYDDD